jgi:N-acetylglucosamine kinase-like BadF-type ATPase
MSADALVVAVDGGGSKTDLAVVGRDGSVLAVVRGGASQAHHLGVDSCAEVLEGLLERAVAQGGLGPLTRPFAAAASFLLAGADLPEESARLRARLEQLKWGERMLLDNDTLALLRAGTDRRWGVAVVCGAGINCLGLAPDGREARFDSLGEISGDWGGGADLGLAALAAAARSADGRGPRTILQRAVPAQLGCSEPLEVSRALHRGSMPVSRLGELAPLVLGTAAEDPVAAAIVERLADEVVAFVRAALGRLELDATDPDVILGGGVLRAASPTVVQRIARGIHEVAPRACVAVCPSEPIVGAALLGLDALGTDAETGARLRVELDGAAARLGKPSPPATPPSVQRTRLRRPRPQAGEWARKR